MDLEQAVQFSADLTKVTLAKKNSITLELPESTTFAKIAEIAQFKGERITLTIGDPQLRMSFPVVEAPRTGVQGKIDSSGVVQSIKTDEEKEENDLFHQEDDDAELEREDAASEEHDKVGEESEIEVETVDEQEQSDDPQQEEIEDDEALIASIENGDYRPDAPVQEAREPEKEEIEAFILQEAPRFEDIPFDFPTLLQRKRQGYTWIELAKELHVNSRDLSKAYGEYKKKVAMKMTGVA